MVSCIAFVTNGMNKKLKEQGQITIWKTEHCRLSKPIQVLCISWSADFVFYRCKEGSKAEPVPNARAKPIVKVRRWRQWPYLDSDWTIIWPANCLSFMRRMTGRMYVQVTYMYVSLHVQDFLYSAINIEWEWLSSISSGINRRFQPWDRLVWNGGP